MNNRQFTYTEASVSVKKDYTGFIRGFARGLLCRYRYREGDRIFVYILPLLNHSRPLVYLNNNITREKADF